MLTFQLKGGLGAAVSLADKIRLFKYATSLGHAHSLLFYYPTDLYVDEVPYLSATQKRCIRAWMGDRIVRASIGLEKAEDLIANLDRALRGRTLKGWIAPLAYRLLRGELISVADRSRPSEFGPRSCCVTESIPTIELSLWH